VKGGSVCLPILANWFGGFLKIFINRKKPCLIRVLRHFAYFVMEFCQHLPIGRYGQRKSSTLNALL
jgi:hypothetical protein